MNTWRILTLVLAASGAASIVDARTEAHAQDPRAIFGAIAGAAAGAIIANQPRPYADPYYAAPPGYYAPGYARPPRRAAVKKPRKPAAAAQARRSDPFAGAGSRAGGGGAVPARYQ